MFEPRFIAPSKGSKFYYSSDNIFHAAKFGMPNCTAYAWGRIYELTGIRFMKLLRSANCWAEDAKKWYPERVEATPSLGSVVCWDGHVAVVEYIRANGDIVCSNSAWKGTEFYLTEHSKAGGWAWKDKKAQCFIRVLDK